MSRSSREAPSRSSARTSPKRPDAPNWVALRSPSRASPSNRRRSAATSRCSRVRSCTSDRAKPTSPGLRRAHRGTSPWSTAPTPATSALRVQTAPSWSAARRRPVTRAGGPPREHRARRYWPSATRRWRTSRYASGRRDGRRGSAGEPGTGGGVSGGRGATSLSARAGSSCAGAPTGNPGPGDDNAPARPPRIVAANASRWRRALSSRSSRASVWRSHCTAPPSCSSA